jgi:hypothetical protein
VTAMAFGVGTRPSKVDNLKSNKNKNLVSLVSSKIQSNSHTSTVLQLTVPDVVRTYVRYKVLNKRNTHLNFTKGFNRTETFENKGFRKIFGRKGDEISG